MAIFGPAGPTEHWRRNAVVSRHSDHHIAMGFAETADLIVEHWRSKGPNDLLFEPLLFNHRHALELVLKAAVRETANRLRVEGWSDPALLPAGLDEWLARKAGHSLHKLATRLDKLLADLGIGTLPKGTHTVLMSIHQLDPGGDTFRYAKVFQGGSWVHAPRPLLTAQNHQVHVDVVAMHEHFRSAFGLISDGVMNVLGEVADYQAELRPMAGP
jgi:hypothetical protein